MSRKPATVGLLSEPYLFEWQVRAIEQMQAELGVEVPLVVIDDPDQDPDSSIDAMNATDRLRVEDVTLFFDHLRRHGAWAAVLAERKLGWLAGDDEPLMRTRAIEDVECLADAEHLRCEPRTEGAWSELPEHAVERVAESCDAAVRFGFGLIRGGILTAPEYGVLSFHPADIRRYRGLGPRRVFVDGRPTAGSTLQRLNETIDGGEIVAFDEVDVRDCHTLWDVEERVSAMQIRLLTEGIANLRDPSFEPTVVPEERLGEYHSMDELKRPTFSGRIVLKNLRGRVRRRLV